MRISARSGTWPADANNALVTRIAVATTSQLAADAAAEVAALGGNAVDCALAAALLAMNSEPGVCAMAGGAYITVWRAGEEPVTIDGNVAIPGRGLLPAQRGQGTEVVVMEYGGGISTLAGAGAVAVPGTPAAIECAWQRYGKASWRDVFVPSIRAARDGFPLSAACHYYLGYSGKCIFGRSDDGYHALHDTDGTLRQPGTTIIIPHLADSLSAIADDGARAFYEGELGVAMTAHVRARGGMLTADDLKQYQAIERPSLQSEIAAWTIASNPPPAVGGTVLAAMLTAFARQPARQWDRDSLARLITVQHACLNYRKRRLDLADDVGAEAARMIDAARSGRLLTQWSSASTVHTSAVDDEGTACAITASSGYGSGEMPRGTGLWLNNCLGELELNRRGLDAGPVGARLPSNMAPSVARRGDTVLAIGSPGADRITTALHQFLVNALQMDMPLAKAVAHPRIHVDTSGESDCLAAEAGLDMPDVDLPLQVYPEINMYFGGVGAASFDKHDGFEAAADPRREGGVCIFNG